MFNIFLHQKGFYFQKEKQYKTHVEHNNRILYKSNIISVFI